MAVSTRLLPIERDIALIVDGDLSQEAQGQQLAAYAREAFDEAAAINRAALGYDPAQQLVVDGAPAASLTGLRGDSTAQVMFSLLTDVIEWIDAQLILNSPVRSGRYARSHILLADGVEVDITAPPPAESYTIINEQPYARKIERGSSSMAPSGVYEAVAVLARRRFGNICHVSFRYVSLQGGAVGAWADTATAEELARRVRGGSSRRHREWLTRQPAIYIDPGL